MGCSLSTLSMLLRCLYIPVCFRSLLSLSLSLSDSLFKRNIFLLYDPSSSLVRSLSICIFQATLINLICISSRTGLDLLPFYSLCIFSVSSYRVFLSTLRIRYLLI